METGKIREAILGNAKEEAEKIKKEAQAKAKELLEKTEKQHLLALSEERQKYIAEANREAAKLSALASLKARQEILQTKDAIIKQIISAVRERISKEKTDKEVLTFLIDESVKAMGTTDKIRLLVSSKDLPAVNEIIKQDKDLQSKIIDVKETDIIGGVIAETTSGTVSINNTFDTRLNMLMPKILPEIAKELFGEN